MIEPWGSAIHQDVYINTDGARYEDKKDGNFIPTKLPKLFIYVYIAALDHHTFVSNESGSVLSKPCLNALAVTNRHLLSLASSNTKGTIPMQSY